MVVLIVGPRESRAYLAADFFLYKTPQAHLDPGGLHSAALKQNASWFLQQPLKCQEINIWTPSSYLVSLLTVRHPKLRHESCEPEEQGAGAASHIWAFRLALKNTQNPTALPIMRH